MCKSAGSKWRLIPQRGPGSLSVVRTALAFFVSGGGDKATFHLKALVSCCCSNRESPVTVADWRFKSSWTSG